MRSSTRSTLLAPFDVGVLRCVGWDAGRHGNSLSGSGTCSRGLSKFFAIFALAAWRVRVRSPAFARRFGLCQRDVTRNDTRRGGLPRSSGGVSGCRVSRSSHRLRTARESRRGRGTPAGRGGSSPGIGRLPRPDRCRMRRAFATFPRAARSAKYSSVRKTESFSATATLIN